MATQPPVGIKSLAVDFPSIIRTNDYWRQHHPDIVAIVEQHHQVEVWNAGEGRALSAFDLEMAPYLRDPFRGAVERRVLGPGESALGLELNAARKALAAASMSPGDIDLAIVTSFFPDRMGPGHAAYFAAELGLRGGAWNLETACSSALVGLQTAGALVRAGEYRNVLVVSSCVYSRATDTQDTISWFCGDGASAFVVGPVDPGYGFLGARTFHSGETCGAFSVDVTADPTFGQRVRFRSNPSAGPILRDTAEPHLRKCVAGALEAAEVELGDIKFFVVPTPTAWYSRFCARVLEISHDRTIDNFPRYANTGPILMPANLFHAVEDGKIARGDLVLLYTIGSVASSGALVMRWGDTALGPAPVRSSAA